MKVIAHRGASGVAPENTLVAIETAIIQQADMIEIDVHAGADGLVVIHDRWLERTTTGQGLVQSHSIAQLKSFDAGMGETIPTLAEVLEFIGGRVDLNVELKSEATASECLNLFDRAVACWGFKKKQFVVSSFNHHLLKEIKTLDSTIAIGALTASRPIDYALFAEFLGARSIHIDIGVIDRCFIEDAHSRNLQVFVYGVNAKLDIYQMLDAGVDGVFTNFPEQTAKVIQQWRLLN